MSNLTTIEKKKLERILEMQSGYLLDFSNRMFEEFFIDNFGIEIYDEKYSDLGNSKANRMRSFWLKESNYTVAKALELIFTEWQEFKAPQSPDKLPEDAMKIVYRLQSESIIPDIDALVPNDTDKTFELLTKTIKECIDNNEPEVGLDRLHTFLVKYLRTACEKIGITIEKEKPLHSLMGEYLKYIKMNSLIESEMTERILKASISIMETFNTVRNDKSLAHDNVILNYEESVYIFTNITSTIKLLRTIEAKRSA